MSPEDLELALLKRSSEHMHDVGILGEAAVMIAKMRLELRSCPGSVVGQVIQLLKSCELTDDEANRIVTIVRGRARLPKIG